MYIIFILMILSSKFYLQSQPLYPATHLMTYGIIGMKKLIWVKQNPDCAPQA